MKKNIIFLMLALAGFIFVGVQSVNAQQNYSITVTWNNSNCQCSEPNYGYVMVFVINTETNDTIINEPWTRDDTSPHLFTGSAPIETDCNCYSVNAAVYYQDGSVCCQGTKVETWQGQKLISGGTIPITNMY
jgi:hypothetical protein